MDKLVPMELLLVWVAGVQVVLRMDWLVVLFLAKIKDFTLLILIRNEMSMMQIRNGLVAHLGLPVRFIGSFMCSMVYLEKLYILLSCC